jgi:cytochrome P450
MRFEPWDRSIRSDPHTFWSHWRDQAGTMAAIGPQTGRTFQFVMAHADVVSALRSPTIGKEPERHLPDVETDFAMEGPFAVLGRNMLFVDPPDHTRLRRLVRDGFSNRAMAALEPRIAQITENLIDRIRGKDEFDLISEFALPLPVTVIAEMLGVPLSDQDRFRSWTQAILGRGVDSEDQIVLAGMEFVNYLNDLAAERRANPTDDLTSYLLHTSEDGDSLSHEEFLAMVFLLLVAGHETTVNLIGNGVVELSSHPDEYARLLDDPGLIPSAVEEILRFHGPVETATLRWAYEPQMFGDTQLAAGDLVIAVLMAANRDPSVFEDPDRFDVARNPKGHVAFGSGIHHCLGAPLARREAVIAFEVLAKQIGRLELAVDRDDLPWTNEIFLRGASSIVVRRASGL